MNVRYGSLPFDEAITYFRGKLNVPTERWNDIWRDGHNNAFMVAGAMKDDLLNDFRQAVDRAIAEGKSLPWFQREFNKIVASHGWQHTGNAAWRSKVIYDTNIRQSYNAGRFEQLQHFDYWEYRHGDSITPRPMHLSWNGLLLEKDDPWWQTHMPQNGWGCKCKVFGRSKATVERKGLTPGKAPNDGSFDWTDKVTGEVHKVPKGIEPGFDYTPSKSVHAQQLQQHAKQKANVYQAPKRLVPTAFSAVKRVNVHNLNDKLSEFVSAKPQIDQLSEFIGKHDVKTLFIKTNEMSRGSRASLDIAHDVQDYLGEQAYSPMSYYTTRRARRVGGFTSREWSHVVVNAKSTTNLKSAAINEMINAVDGAILFHNAGSPMHTISHIVRSFADSKAHSAPLVTWLHELGHQVHYKAGMPNAPFDKTLTTYAMTNEFEWHAEHFVAWVLNREALAKWSPEIAEYMDELMKKGLGND